MLRLSVLLLLGLQLSATTLTGTLKLPDGTGANGYLYMSLSQQAALMSTGGCGGPIQVVPTYEVRITVTDGALQGSPTVYGNDCLLPQGTYYKIRFVDRGGVVLLTDRWLITGASIDIGTIESVVITGTTQTLGGAGIILTYPATSQAVAQPPSTTLSVNDLTLTSKLTFPGNLICTITGCTFGNGSIFNGGIATHPVSNSEIYINNGNLYIRLISGGDAPCAGATDGWFALRTDTQELQICFNSTTYKVQMLP